MFQRFLAHALCRTLEITLTLFVLAAAVHVAQWFLATGF